MSGQNQKNINQNDLNEQIEDLIQFDLEEKSTPIEFTNVYANIPHIPLGICGCFFIICLYLSASGGMFAFNPSSSRDYLIWDEQKTHEQDQFTAATQSFSLDIAGQEKVPLQTISVNQWSTNIIFECAHCENVMSIDNLKLINKVEKKIKEIKNYDKFCQKTAVGECKPILTITSLFSDPDNITQTQVDDQLQQFIFLEENWPIWSALFSQDFHEQNVKSKLIRSIFSFGTPIHIEDTRYTDQYDREDEQKSHFTQFSSELKKVISDLNDENVQVNIYAYSSIIQSIELTEKGVIAILLIIVSLFFVWIYLTFKFESMFLSGMAVTQLIMSFPFTALLFRIVLGVQYFSMINLSILFLVIGFISNDTIIMYDAWKQSGLYEELQFHFPKRMALTFRRATKTLIAPTLLKAIIFWSAGFSQIIPLSSLGLWAGTMVLVNFLETILYFPAIIMIWELVVKYKACCQRCRKTITETEQERIKVHGSHSFNNSKGLENVKDNNQILNSQYMNNSNYTQSKNQNPKQFQTQQYDEIVKDKCINEQQVINSTRQNSPLNQPCQEELQIKNSHQVEDIQLSQKQEEQNQMNMSNYEKRKKYFKQDTGLSRSQLGISQSFSKRSDIVQPKLEYYFENIHTKFINTFKYIISIVLTVWIFIAFFTAVSFSEYKQQEQMFSDSNPVQKGSNLLNEEFYPSKAGGTQLPVFFFIGTEKMDRRGINAWNATNIGQIIWEKDFDFSKTENQLALVELCSDLHKDENVIDDAVYCWPELFAQWAMVNEIGFPVQENKFDQLVTAYSQDPMFGRPFYNMKTIGLINGKLKYVGLLIFTKAKTSYNGLLLQPFYEHYQNFVKKFNEKISNTQEKDTQNFLKQTCPFLYSFMESQKEFVKNAVQCLSMGVIASFLILCFSTKNIILSLIGILNIVGVLASSVAIFSYKGWQLGISESIIFTCLTSLTVDYTLHIVFSYNTHPYQDKFNRTKQTLKNMGTSILSGGFSSFTAGLILAIAPLLIFQKLGFSIFITCLMSVVFALVYLPSLLLIAGPNKDFGRITFFTSEYLSSQEYEILEEQLVQEKEELEELQRQVVFEKENGINNENENLFVKSNQKNLDSNQNQQYVKNNDYIEGPKDINI